jgi:hypothetical protein
MERKVESRRKDRKIQEKWEERVKGEGEKGKWEK